ncbi:dihydrolipoyllysine-residue succinyltransferase [Blochmannia endosymbiont of Colobopsis nipponica]|uniref:dihydrolipoyllysine-residue succinyltransferase n=1 Tax=Blochmannia endosymbiont of Colobopsis nipponica TaxID=2681987 RepID=UPI0017851EC5|nr:dihydrolipoyllysine-residue succinyltransferase [Blochmannia endosymbiont of Colobopsis nipponica]QOI11112.1 dihydrolipoyllysine-residue succinyltransferase [Blochmannia endosymbiont of Colobopsis nipponica]
MNSINILVPDLPESVMDATVAVWHKKIGDTIQRNDILVEIETDKLMLEIPAQKSGILEEIIEKEGAVVVSKQILGRLIYVNYDENNKDNLITDVQKQVIQSQEDNNETSGVKNSNFIQENKDPNVSLNQNKMIDEQCVHQDKFLDQTEILSALTKDRNETRIPMTRLRKRIAERLVEVKQNTAMLTTFNEVNMKPIIELRKKYAASFEQRHGVKLGFMSFYVKAVFESLKKFPEINASIDGEEIVYYNYFDISIAVSTDRGLVTPVLRNVDTMSMIDIEKNIKLIAMRSRDGKLLAEELDGGNFTISNGGIFGSLMSTPIINPPQSAILGMHVIKDRPMVVDQQIVILPMMYLALSYDHRLIDGRNSIGFLNTVKSMLEEPLRLWLGI